MVDNIDETSQVPRQQPYLLIHSQNVMSINFDSNVEEAHLQGLVARPQSDSKTITYFAAPIPVVAIC